MLMVHCNALDTHIYFEWAGKASFYIESYTHVDKVDYTTTNAMELFLFVWGVSNQLTDIGIDSNWYDLVVVPALSREASKHTYKRWTRIHPH